MKMTARSVAALKRPLEGQKDIFDGSLPGFGMRLSYGGTRTWTLFYRHNGVKRRMKIGNYPALPLAAARDRARAALHDVAVGKDPAAEKVAYRESETVADLAREYLDKHAKVKKRSWQHDERTLRNDVLPAIGKLKAKDVRRRDIIRLLDKVKERSPIMANRTLEIVRKMFAWGVSQDIVEANICTGIARPSEEPRRERVLMADEIRCFWAAAAKEESRAGLVLQLLLFTAQREGEVLKMRWQNIEEGDEYWWTIPGEIAKNGLAHRVPLSKPVITILRDIRAQRPDPTYVFARRGGGAPATASLIRKPLNRIRHAAGLEDFVPHDLRRTAASYMTGMGIPRLTVAKVLNHAEAGVTSVYDRHSYDPEKRHALDAWAQRLMEIVSGSVVVGSVVPLLRNQAEN
jgi:integrase